MKTKRTKACVVEASFRTSFCTKTSTRFCTECGLVLNFHDTVRKRGFIPSVVWPLCSAPCLWVQADHEQDHYTGLCSYHDNKRPQNKREALAYCQGLGKPYSRPGCKNPVCQNDNLHWVNTPTLDSCFGLVGHHQQGAPGNPLAVQRLFFARENEALSFAGTDCQTINR